MYGTAQMFIEKKKSFYVIRMLLKGMGWDGECETVG
jgi:hypothetical protein